MNNSTQLTMEDQELTYRSVLLDTMLRYTSATRATMLGGQCIYSTKPETPEKGRRCAVGYYMDPALPHEVWAAKSGVGTLALRLGGLKYLLAPNARHLDSIEFWTGLQSFHDARSFWAEDGLTDVGLRFAQDIANEFSLGDVVTEYLQRKAAQ